MIHQFPSFRGTTSACNSPRSIESRAPSTRVSTTRKRDIGRAKKTVPSANRSGSDSAAGAASPLGAHRPYQDSISNGGRPFFAPNSFDTTAPKLGCSRSLRGFVPLKMYCRARS